MTMHTAVTAALEMRLGRPLWATGDYLTEIHNLAHEYALGIDADDVLAVYAHFDADYDLHTLKLRGFEVRMMGGDVLWFAADDARFEPRHMARIERVEADLAEEHGAFTPYEYMPENE